jgi:DNA (cytosine-5)-methyltransferase 1
MKENFTIASFFSGCGGLDLGFENAGFKVVYANDIWKGCQKTFEYNHQLPLDTRSIEKVKSEDVPEVTGFVGGPPCQSWSLAGAMRGIKDPRGKLFYEYIRLLEEKKPYFFLAENVSGMLSKTHKIQLLRIIQEFNKVGYTVSYKLVNAADYGVPQDRKRVIIVGYRKDLGIQFVFPEPNKNKVYLRQALGDLPPSLPAQKNNRANKKTPIPNHEHFIGSYSSMYMSRNRKRSFSEVSFTIQAGGRHAPIHPASPDMIQTGVDKWKFKSNQHEYRRMSVRECARIQTFPDTFIFFYKNVADGYKMIGNAVPVKLSQAIAEKIADDLINIKDVHIKRGKIECQIPLLQH